MWRWCLPLLAVCMGASGTVQAESDWGSEFGQGVTAYRTKNVEGDVLSLTCGSVFPEGPFRGALFLIDGAGPPENRTRSDELRVGTECVRPCRSGWSPVQKKKQ